MANNNYVKSFKGKLNGKKIEDFTKQLDYSIENTEDRIELVRDILYPDGELDDYFAQYFFGEADESGKKRNYFKVELNKTDPLSEDNNVCKKLEQMANYILFCDKDKNENTNYNIMTKNDKKRTQRYEKESYDNLLQKKDKNGFGIIEKEIINAKNYKKKVVQKIYKKDLENKYIKQIQIEIDKLKHTHDNREISSMQKRLHKKAMVELKDNQKLTKDLLYKPVVFKSPLPDTAKFIFDDDTGYYDENGDYILVSENNIELSNSYHVYQLINNYSSLRMDCAEDVHSNMRYLLDSLDEIIESCDFRDFEKDIIIMRIDRLPLQEISDSLKLKYGLDYEPSYISNIFKNRICKKIALKNSLDFEDWFYFQRAVGTYKQCSKCGQVKLANERYFKYDITNKRYKSRCRRCDG